MTTTTNNVKIEYMPLSKLLRAPRNPKDHDLGTIGQSIQRFGFVNPLLINETSGKLVAGHGRLDVLQRMKARGESAPERVVDQNGEWFVPVIRGVGFDTDDEAEAYLIADNKLSEIGGWDEAELTQVLSDLAAKGEEMLRGIGFDLDDLDAMLRAGTGDPAHPEQSEEYTEQWLVLIECASEDEQRDTLETLTGMGLKCRALVS